MNLNLRNRRDMKMLGTVQLIALPEFIRKGHSPGWLWLLGTVTFVGLGH